MPDVTVELTFDELFPKIRSLLSGTFAQGERIITCYEHRRSGLIEALIVTSIQVIHARCSKGFFGGDFQEATSYSTILDQIIGVSKNQYVVSMKKKGGESGPLYENFQIEDPNLQNKLISQLNGAIAAYRTGNSSKPGKVEMVDELERLARLWQSGALTQQEFEQAKKKLLE